MGQEIRIKDFQTTVDGNQTDLFFLENANGMRAAITNYGARVVAIWVPDTHGTVDNVVACYDSIEGYLNHDDIYLGAIVGRYANRIKGASFELHGKEYLLSANDGPNLLHGGNQGFHKQVWQADQTKLSKLKLSHLSADGSEGFPGNLQVDVIYTLTEANELLIEYVAKSDRDTIINLSNHCYFNLGGETGRVHARDHYISIEADRYLPVYTDLLPIGEIAEVENTPFDLRELQLIRERVDLEHPQLARGGGFDHCFVLNKEKPGSYALSARLTEKKTGRALSVKTTEPGLQFFECEFDKELDLHLNSGICLETQHFPYSQNHSHFPSTVLKAGRQFTSTTAYTFSTLS